MTQSPYGSTNEPYETDPYQAGSGFVTPPLDDPTYDPAPGAPATGTTGGASAYGSGTGSTGTPKTSDVAKDEAADLKDTAASRGQDVAGTAKEQAGQVKDTAVEQGQQVVGTAKEQAGQVVAEASAQARDLFNQGRAELGSQASNQQNRLATIVHGFADELGSMASSSDKSGPLTDLAHNGARRGGEIAHWLQDNEPSDLLEQVKSFARRRPVAFLAGSVLAGVVVGRLTRSLAADARSDDDDADQTTTGRYAAPTGPAYEAAPATTGYPGTGYAPETGTGYAGGTGTDYVPGTEYVPGTGYAGGTGSGYADPAPTYGTPGSVESYPDTPGQGGYAR